MFRVSYLVSLQYIFKVALEMFKCIHSELITIPTARCGQNNKQLPNALTDLVRDAPDIRLFKKTGYPAKYAARSL